MIPTLRHWPYWVKLDKPKPTPRQRMLEAIIIWYCLYALAIVGITLALIFRQ